MGLMFLLTMLCCAPKNPSGVSEPVPDEAANADGLIGMRFQALPEGLLVEEVQPGMGAEAAGLGVGGDLRGDQHDLVLLVDLRPWQAPVLDDAGPEFTKKHSAQEMRPYGPQNIACEKLSRAF